jgi:putative IMPACT (imprinted ancient) family translation regulator
MATAFGPATTVSLQVSAGKPILGQIDSRELTNIAIIVVRYFGGSLLGVPGLINAYKTASGLVLQITPLVTKSIVTKYRVEFDYTKMNEVLKVIRQCNISVISQQTQLFCSIEAAIPIIRVTEALQRLGEIENVELIKLD